MDNFSKFLTNREGLRMICKTKTSHIKVYFIILLFLLAFFILFPMLKIGYQGFFLWLFLIIMLIFWLAKEMSEQNMVYLLSNKRLIHLKQQSKKDYKLLGFIKLIDIETVYKQGKKICIVSEDKKYYLSSLDKANELYKKLKSYIKS